MSTTRFFRAQKSIVFPTRNEGKPLRDQLKYYHSNYPELFWSLIGVIFLPPIVGFIRYRLVEPDGGYDRAIEKFKSQFTVVRPSHPDIEGIKAQKEFGKDYFKNYN